MNTKTTGTPQVGQLAVLVFSGRTSSDTQLMVTEVSSSGRQVTATGITGAGFNPMGGVYTLRKNGRYARQGGGQWSEYLRLKGQS